MVFFVVLIIRPFIQHVETWHMHNAVCTIVPCGFLGVIEALES
jgi:hypothetical protein